VALAFAGSATTTALSEDTTHQKSTPIPPRCTAQAFESFSERVWRLDRWRRGKPRPKALQARRRRLSCARDAHRRAMKRTWARDRVRYGRYRVYRQVAPYPGPGSGPPSPADRRWWSVPWYVVCGESGGDFTINTDGAYQIIPSTWAAYGGLEFAPYPAAATPLEQHIVAARIREGAGLGAWYGAC
jgi:transglycosylase-like protein